MPTFVSHASLSLDEHRQAETAFAAEPDCVIVATSTLELGLDVGDLDRVIQVGAPPSVASFLQRMGRTGRRVGTRRNCLLLATEDEELLTCLAVASLWQEGSVEPVVAPPRPAHFRAAGDGACTPARGSYSGRTRTLVGSGRFEGLEAAQVLARLYAAARLYVNFFQPSFNLKRPTGC